MRKKKKKKGKEESRKVRYVRVSGQLLFNFIVEFMRTTDVPPDFKVVRFYPYPGPKMEEGDFEDMEVLLHSEMFEEVPEGEEIPVISVVSGGLDEDCV